MSTPTSSQLVIERLMREKNLLLAAMKCYQQFGALTLAALRAQRALTDQEMYTCLKLSSDACKYAEAVLDGF